MGPHRATCNNDVIEYGFTKKPLVNTLWQTQIIQGDVYIIYRVIII